MKKIYLLYEKSHKDKTDYDIGILKSYDYNINSDYEKRESYLNIFDNDLDNENILLILNYDGVIRNKNWLQIVKLFYKENQTIMLLNNIPKSDEMNVINSMNPIVLNGDLTKLKGRKNHLLDYFTKEELERIKNISDLYIRAFIITTAVFKDKTDKNGKPYFDHLFRVSQSLDVPSEKIAGLLHEILEDTEIKPRDLKEVGITNEILEIVKLVTKSKANMENMNEKDEINTEVERIISSGNVHAISLKYADIADNYNLNKLKKLPLKEQMLFIKKYGLQLMRLKKEKERYYDRYQFDKRK